MDLFLKDFMNYVIIYCTFYCYIHQNKGTKEIIEDIMEIGECKTKDSFIFLLKARIILKNQV
jgi:hypothetical protein